MASFDFEMDFKAFEKALDRAEEAVIEGAINGVNDALEYWQLKATNLAPIGRYKGRRGGNLRARIDHTTPKVGLDGISGSVVANAFNNGFNYAYYLHNSTGLSAREPGTVLDFLEQAKNDSESRMHRLIEDAIEAELRRKGMT
ncbi:hypothetical protein [Paenibacillus dakarensis]|uniref:hypothetical protein n=1 Tax=Paenibacillus dakarensis TaxID=1527293 RepID=UPI0006D55E4E|nr:hypothetical protein [Paenibacillus dakarensis]